MISTNQGLPSSSKNNFKPFYFNHNWMLDENYKEVMVSQWNLYNHLNNLPSKLADLANFLKGWADKTVGSLPKEIKRIQNRINNIREADIMSCGKDMELKLEATLEKLFRKEEVYWHQISRVNRLNSGDQNTAFFHKAASSRRRRNSIVSLARANNTLTSEQKEVEEIVTNYFTSLFSTQHPTPGDISNITNLLPRVVSHDMQEHLARTFTPEEVRKALFDLSPSKAPGLPRSSSKMHGIYWVKTLPRQCLGFSTMVLL